MKKKTTPRALIGPALLIAFGLLLMVAGITSSPWHLDGGIVGRLLNLNLKNPMSIMVFILGGIVSLALSALLTLVGLVGVAAGLVTGVLGLSRRRSRARSIGWLLVGALMVALVALAYSTFRSTSGRSPAGRRAAAVKARAALQKQGFGVSVGYATGKVLIDRSANTRGSRAFECGVLYERVRSLTFQGEQESAGWIGAMRQGDFVANALWLPWAPQGTAAQSAYESEVFHVESADTIHAFRPQ
ncbi:MAG TPA: hypothetical protein VG013_19960 [Gemmataceae bacterium]|nr:hypothetical protein [Gemmataceae bacterium]